MPSKPPVAGLSNFIASPREAKPLATAPQRGPEPAPQRPLAAVSGEPSRGQGVRALTLRVDNDLYGRLRRFAFDRELTHQEILEQALRAYLDMHGG
jgi:hypothetical protein